MEGCELSNPFGSRTQLGKNLVLALKSPTLDIVKTEIKKIYDSVKTLSDTLKKTYLFELLNFLFKNPLFSKVVTSGVRDFVDSSKLELFLNGDLSLPEVNESLLELETEKHRDYLDEYFGTLGTEIRERFKAKVDRDLIFTMLLLKKRSENGNWELRFQQNDKSLNISIEEYKKLLALTIKEYIQKANPNVYQIIKDLDFTDSLFMKTLHDLIFYVNGKFDTNTFSKLDLNNIGTSSKAPVTLKARALRSYITLMHFNQLLSDDFGNIIRIKDKYKNNNFTLAKEGIYQLDPLSSNNRDWRDDNKDYDELEEIGNLNLLLLQVFPNYRVDQISPEDTQYSLAAFSKGRTALLDAQYDIRLQAKCLDLITLRELIKSIKDIFSEFYGTTEDSEGNSISPKLEDILLDLSTLTISEAISKMNMYPIDYAPIVLYILLHNNTFREVVSSDLLDAIYSMYKNIYDVSDTSEALIKYYDPEVFSNNFFKYINLAFETIQGNHQITYTYLPGLGVVIVQLANKADEARLYLLSTSLDNRNSILSKRKLKGIEIDTSELNTENENKPKIIIKIGNYKIIVEGPDIHRLSAIDIYLNDLNLKKLDLDKHGEALFPLINLVLGFNSLDDLVTLSNLKTFQINCSLTSLIYLASRCLYRKCVSLKVRELNLGNTQLLTTNFIDQCSEYVDNPVLLRGTELELKVTSNKDIGVRRTIAQALRYLNGASPENTARDASGNLIGLSGLSALVHKGLLLMYTTKYGQPSSDFQLRNLISGLNMIRDVKVLGDVKKSTALNAKELYELNFLYDYYLGRFNYNYGEKLWKDNEEASIQIMGMVISDKFNLEKIAFRFNLEVNIYDNEGNKIGLKVFKDLTLEELRNLISKELGDYFQKVHDKLIAECTIINQYLPETVTFTPDDNYASWNTYINLIKRPNQSFDEAHNDILHSIIHKALLDGHNIEISENLFGGFKKVDNKIVGFAANHTLYDILYRTNHWKSSYSEDTLQNKINNETYFNEANTLLINDLLYLDINLDLSDLTSQPIKTKILKFNEDYMDGSKIGFFKIIGLGDKPYIVSSKLALLRSHFYLDTLDYLKEDEEANIKYGLAFDINSAAFDITKIIEAYNEYGKQIEFNKTLNFYKRTLINLYKKNINSIIENLDINEIKNQIIAWVNNNPNATKLKTDIFSLLLNDELNTITKYYPLVLLLNIETSTKVEELPSRIAEEIHKYDLERKVEFKEFSEISIQINPELEKHNLTDMYIAEEYTLLQVGSHINHPGKNEVARLGARIKRNVSETAAKQQFDYSHIDSVSELADIIVIDDSDDKVFNTCGIIARLLSYDGATITCGVLSILENNSLGNARAGLNKKPFFHGINKYGQGFIIKTAGFDCNNDMIRRSEAFERLNKIFLNRNWKEPVDITKDYYDNEIDYGECYYFDGKSHWKINKIIKDSSLDSDANPNSYSFMVEQVSADGKSLGIIRTIHKVINNNYLLWEAFGGAYSESINEDGVLSYINDNSSMEKVALACCKVGTIKKSKKYPNLSYSKVVSQLDVNLILKNALICYGVGAGAMKLGAANINSSDILNNDDYEYTTMTIDMRDAGILLDAEHHSEDSVLSLMTQVVNALGARGYTSKKAELVYNALNIVTHLALNDCFVGLNKYLHDPKDDAEFKDALAEIIIKTLKSTTTTDGLLLNAIHKNIEEAANNSKNKYNAILGKLPLSNASVFNKIMSGIASALSKSAIKLKPPGSLSVLVPSNGLILLYGDRFIDLYNFGTTNKSEIKSKLKKESLKNPIIDYKDLNFEASYFITDGEKYYNLVNGQLVLTEFKDAQSIRIDDPINYYALESVLGDFKLLLDSSAGRNLASSRILFDTLNGEHHNIWDLDTTKSQFYCEVLKKKLKKEDLNTLLDTKEYLFVLKTLENYHYLGSYEDFSGISDFLKLIHQQELDAIGDGNASRVFINGKELFINKDSIRISNYEVIAPKMYSSEFGLKPGDVVGEIIKDREFFLKRLVKKFAGTADLNSYDIAMRANNGNHLYLLYDDGYRTLPKNLLNREVVPLNTMWVDLTLWRIDSNGNKMYKIPTKDGKANLRVFKDAEGNEILMTNNLSFFLTLKGYIYTLLSTRITETLGNTSDEKAINALGNLFMELKKSDSNPKIKGLLSHIVAGIDSLDEIEALEELGYNYFTFDLKRIPLLIKRINTLASNIDKLIKDLEKVLDTNGDILKFVNNLEDVDGSIFVLHLINSAHLIHTSFVKSLNFLAARIPSLSQQSFMAMTVVGFDESGLNNTYVSRWQLYLLGSK